MMSGILYEGIHDLSRKEKKINYGTQKPLKKGNGLLNMEIKGFSSFLFAASLFW